MNHERAKALAKLAGWRDTPTVRDAFAGFDMVKFSDLVESAINRDPYEVQDISELFFDCRVCNGSGLLQHHGGPEYATHCTECENEQMIQVSELDKMIYELRRGYRSHGSTPLHVFHMQVARMLETLARMASK